MTLQRIALVCLALAVAAEACSSQASLPFGGPLALSSAAQEIRPGAWRVPLTLEVRTSAAIAVPTLSFVDDEGGDIGEFFEWREAEPLAAVPTSAGVIAWEIDVSPRLPLAAPREVHVRALAGEAGESNEVVWKTAPLTEFSVTSADDSGPGSLRDALAAAAAATGVRRVTIAVSGTALIASALPALGDGTIVVTGSGSSFTLAPDLATLTSSQVAGLDVGGEATIAGLTFRDWAGTFSTVGGPPYGAAIRGTGASVALRGIVVSDPSFPAKDPNQYAQVRFHGDDVLIDRCQFTLESGTMAVITAEDALVRDSFFAGSSNSDGINASTQSPESILQIEGTVFFDSYYPVIARGNTAATITSTHDVFASYVAGSASINSRRRVVSRNDAFIGAPPFTCANSAAVTADHDRVEASAWVFAGAACMLVSTAGSSFGPLLVVDSRTSASASFVPLPGSPLLDAGATAIDRIPSSPARFKGSNPDAGAFESQ